MKKEEEEKHKKTYHVDKRQLFEEKLNIYNPENLPNTSTDIIFENYFNVNTSLKLLQAPNLPFFCHWKSNAITMIY